MLYTRLKTTVNVVICLHAVYGTTQTRGNVTKNVSHLRSAYLYIVSIVGTIQCNSWLSKMWEYLNLEENCLKQKETRGDTRVRMYANF